MKSVLSYGGGLDSFAMLLGAVDRGEAPDVVAFVDVGDGGPDRDGQDPGEWTGTYRHVREVVMPLCRARGIEFVWITSRDYPIRDARSLFFWLKARRQIPVSGPRRICTIVAKVERFERWMTERFPGQDVEVWIGFEAGEEARAQKDPNAGTGRKLKAGDARRANRFPLIERGLCRCRCEALVRAHGMPVPRKSACVFCPYGTKADWKTFARELPEQFAQIVALEADKPPTAKGKKLSIRGFRTLKDKAGNEIGYRATPLPVYIEQAERAAPAKLCGVCGDVRASKAVGCGYLEAPQ